MNAWTQSLILLAQLDLGEAFKRAAKKMRRGAFVLGTPGLEDALGRKDALAELHTQARTSIKHTCAER